MSVRKCFKIGFNVSYAHRLSSRSFSLFVPTSRITGRICRYWRISESKNISKKEWHKEQAIKYKGNPVYTLELSQKTDCQPSTRKPDTRAIQLLKPDKFGLWMVSKVVLYFQKNKILKRSKKSKLIHFKSEKYETGIKIL